MSGRTLLTVSSALPGRAVRRHRSERRCQHVVDQPHDEPMASEQVSELLPGQELAGDQLADRAGLQPRHPEGCGRQPHLLVVVHGCVHGYGVYVQLQQRFGHRPDVTVQVRKGSACHWLLPWLVASGVLPPNRRAAAADPPRGLPTRRGRDGRLESAGWRADITPPGRRRRGLPRSEDLAKDRAPVSAVSVA